MCGLRLHREQIRASKNLKVCEEREWVITRLNMHPVMQFFVHASIHPQWYASSLNWHIRHISLFQTVPAPFISPCCAHPLDPGLVSHLTFHENHFYRPTCLPPLFLGASIDTNTLYLPFLVSLKDISCELSTHF